MGGILSYRRRFVLMITTYIGPRFNRACEHNKLLSVSVQSLICHVSGLCLQTLV